MLRRKTVGYTIVPWDKLSFIERNLVQLSNTVNNMKKIDLFTENNFALLQVKSTSNDGKWTQFKKQCQIKLRVFFMKSSNVFVFKIIRLFSLNDNIYACHILMTSLIFIYPSGCVIFRNIMLFHSRPGTTNFIYSRRSLRKHTVIVVSLIAESNFSRRESD